MTAPSSTLVTSSAINTSVLSLPNGSNDTRTARRGPHNETHEKFLDDLESAHGNFLFEPFSLDDIAYLDSMPAQAPETIWHDQTLNPEPHPNLDAMELDTETLLKEPQPEASTPDPIQLGRSSTGGPPSYVLTQHFTRQLTSRFSSKAADWTFYTYFFHRFTPSHPWVMSSLLAWTSASLHFSSVTGSLQTAKHHHEKCLQGLYAAHGVQVDALTGSIGEILENATVEDIDAIFVGLYFLALYDLMLGLYTAIPAKLRLIASILRLNRIKSDMVGVRARVTTWFYMLECKSCTFKSSGRAILSAVGGHTGLLSVLKASHNTLHQVYNTTYPDEERALDELKLPLLERMMQLMGLLGDMTDIKGRREDDANELIRVALTEHGEAIQLASKASAPHSRVRPTVDIIEALYLATEILFSRTFDPSQALHSKNDAAMRIIGIAQMRQTSAGRTPPPTKIWPLPLVVAAIEVKDVVYREWALMKLEIYVGVGGYQYRDAKAFVEAVISTEEKMGKRVDLGDVLCNLNPGLIV